MNSPKTIVVYNPIRFQGETWLPVLWAQAKTYYEKHGAKVDEWKWAPCYSDLWSSDINRVKEILLEQKPDVFAVSLYVWNYTLGHEIAKWVKEQWPNCLIVTGGPHQYFKHDDNWFKSHPYIDASLPGESYGELCIQEILDNVSPGGEINWNTVSDISYPYGKSRMPTRSTKSIYTNGKKQFDYSWSAFSSQLLELKHLIEYSKQHNKKTKSLSIFETTRGCPYGCTYCDWGGGINSVVLKRPIDAIKQDVDAMCQLGLNYVYFADANFGIFGDRDVEVISYLAEARKKNLQTFTVGYGGFAKTENKLPYIQKILKVDVQHELSMLGEIKVSVQSLDKDVLKRIDRKNVPFEKQIAMLKSLTWFKKLPIYIELIYGLPGMTLDKFYHELDEFGSRKLSIQWYPWILLPEAPAYSKAYRQQEGINTLIKTVGWWYDDGKGDDHNYNEIVIKAGSYSKDDYLEMILSSGLYKLFVQGGYFYNTVKWLQARNVNPGQLIKGIYQEFYLNSKFKEGAYDSWHNDILTKEDLGCFIPVTDTHGETHDVYAGFYFIALMFLFHSDFNVPLGKWLTKKYNVPVNLIEKDLRATITQENFGTKKRHGLIMYSYKKKFYNLENNLKKVFAMFLNFNSTGHIVKARGNVF